MADDRNITDPAEHEDIKTDVKDHRRREVLRSIKFVLFSISAGVIEALVFTLLENFTDWKYWGCYLPALVISVLWNFTLNREFTFKSANNIPIAMLKVTLFYLVFTPVTTIGGNYLSEELGWNEYLVTGINMALNFVLEYLYDMFYVFRGTLDTNKQAEREKEKE